MKRFLFWLACFVLLFCTGAGVAQHCGYNATGYSTYNGYQNYVAPANNYNVIEYRVLEVPLYSAGYSAAGTDPFVFTELTKEIRDLNVNLKNFNLVKAQPRNDNHYESPQGGGYNKPLPQGNDGQRFLALLHQDCKTCHGGPRPQGGFRLFNENDQVVLTCENMLNIIEHVYIKGDMPKNHPYTQEQKDIVMEGVSFYLNQKGS